ncbi:hypothetical protein BCL90_3869 [Pedobacter alluvionis]|uniref:Uncharacterized protein n=1 Tax=Pedobacter alluvionis TaxID=475253 RepID=A0A497XVC9_9SPHI|nr:hypothetical protein BCL90_3869 [Pedobacter alluvionis]
MLIVIKDPSTPLTMTNREGFYAFKLEIALPAPNTNDRAIPAFF